MEQKFADKSYVVKSNNDAMPIFIFIAAYKYSYALHHVVEVVCLV